MRYKRPGPADNIFETPAALRPDLDLGLSAAPYTLSSQMRHLDTGVTRWFDLVYGFALDAAPGHRLSARQVNASLEAGRVAVQTSFFQFGPARQLLQPREINSLPDGRATFIGSVSAAGSDLVVSGGVPFSTTSGLLYQRQEDDTYVPFAAHAHRPGTGHTSQPIEWVRIPRPYVYNAERIGSPAELPDPLLAAYRLGRLAEITTLSLDYGVMSARSHISPLYNV